MKNYFKIFSVLIAGLLLVTSCGDDEPEIENVNEVFNTVELKFTELDAAGNKTSTVIEAASVDPDNDGPLPPVADAIQLVAGKTYELDLEIIFADHEEHEEGEEHDDEDDDHGDEEDDDHDHEEGDVTEEIKEEAHVHQLFFSFTDGIFSDPTGSGNIDGTGTINYLDFDENQLPLGLETEWTAGDVTSTAGTFRIRLQHMEVGGTILKDESADSNTGSNDFDLEWDITIVAE